MLELKTESTEVLNSLDTLSTMYTTNDATNRRQLKTTIEQRGIDTNRSFLHAADVVLQVVNSLCVRRNKDATQALDAVEGDVGNLKAACARISDALRESKASTSEMLAEVDRCVCLLTLHSAAYMRVHAFASCIHPWSAHVLSAHVLSARASHQCPPGCKKRCS